MSRRTRGSSNSTDRRDEGGVLTPAKPEIPLDWKCCKFTALPSWLQDNHFLLDGHRPVLLSFKECFKSIFRIHTETMNIWTHLVGMLLFFVLTIQFLTRPEIQLQEKFVFTAFFVGAIACLGFSTVFHTLHCHSREVAKFVHKLDYVGIALLIMGSFFPWVYYGFYCKPHLQIIYMTVTLFLGTLAIIASMMDTFAEPRFRPIRAGLFAGFGLSGVIPAVHYASANGLVHSVTHDPMGWLVLMAFLYLLGAVIYAGRVPERWFLGKCDIWGHSHQLFHVLVVAAALVNYHGIMQIAKRRLTSGECRNEL